MKLILIRDRAVSFHSDTPVSGGRLTPRRWRAFEVLLRKYKVRPRHWDRNVPWSYRWMLDSAYAHRGPAVARVPDELEGFLKALCAMRLTRREIREIEASRLPALRTRFNVQRLFMPPGRPWDID